MTSSLSDAQAIAKIKAEITRTKRMQNKRIDVILLSGAVGLIALALLMMIDHARVQAIPGEPLTFQLIVLGLLFALVEAVLIYQTIRAKSRVSDLTAQLNQLQPHPDAAE